MIVDLHQHIDFWRRACDESGPTSVIKHLKNKYSIQIANIKNGVIQGIIASVSDMRVECTLGFVFESNEHYLTFLLEHG